VAASHYDRLSFQDTTYLALERTNSYMHIAGIQVFEAGPLRTPDGGIDIDRIRAFIGSKLHLIPRYRQRLEWIPIDGFPVWVDDDRFNLDYHVRHTSLPRPGTDTELKQLAARVFAQPLDRSKPLWETWLVEGLDGDRFASVVKVHHSMIDGMEGVDLLKVLLELYPNETIQEAPVFEPRPVPSRAELAVSEVGRLVRLPRDLMRTARDLAGGEGARREFRHRMEAAYRAARSGWFTKAARTPVNQALGSHRRFEWLTTPLEDVKYVKNHLGGTVNDTVLAVMAGAIRSFMGARRHDTGDEPFRIMIPVSMRTDEQQGALGNQVAMWLLELPIAEPDPVRRLDAVRRGTDELKNSDAALGATTLTHAASWMPLTLLSLGVRVAWSAIRPFNMTVTNVPGPQIPIYLLGAKMVAMYPMVPLYMDHGIGVALFSYDGDVDWGISADYDLVPDLDHFAEAIRASLAELVAAAGRAAERAVPLREKVHGLFAGTGAARTVSATELAGALGQDPSRLRSRLRAMYPDRQKGARWSIDEDTALAVADQLSRADAR
jgi:WS/DGAT/MGAT family acyltransferase